MKKVPLILASFVFFSITAVGLAMANFKFSDVTPEDWFYTGVQYSSEHNLMTGYNSSQFGPNDSVTRGQLSSILERMEAGKIQEMYRELLAIRQAEVKKLTGSSWEEYIKAFERFPSDGIQIVGEGYMSYQQQKNDLKLLVTDEKEAIELLSSEPISSQILPFFIKRNGMGGGVFGPFYDDLERITKEIEINN